MSENLETRQIHTEGTWKLIECFSMTRISWCRTAMVHQYCSDELCTPDSASVSMWPKKVNDKINVTQVTSQSKSGLWQFYKCDGILASH